MPATLRTFIGIPIPATPAIEVMLRELKGMGRNVRSTPPGQLHLTLKFLGETPRDVVPSLRKVLTEVAGGAARHSIRLVGLGAFPSPARPTVIWVGIQPDEVLKRMAAALDAHLEPLGFVPESRPYHPHLTLARVNGLIPGLQEFLAEHPATPFGDCVVNNVTLYQSEPAANGSRYTDLSSSTLPAQ
ncbi:MAG TPA: RNA 2',3'-cyclic phosphodiesterase [Caulifigura sp.]|nr:RNA 2',3'-cyclic phosphodiesterase [Caulifigura sp.]